jgi:hypothetical protein
VVVFLHHVDHHVIEVARAGEIGGESGQPRVVALERGIDGQTAARPAVGGQPVGGEVEQALFPQHLVRTSSC